MNRLYVNLKQRLIWNSLALSLHFNLIRTFLHQSVNRKKYWNRRKNIALMEVSSQNSFPHQIIDKEKLGRHSWFYLISGNRAIVWRCSFWQPIVQFSIIIQFAIIGSPLKISYAKMWISQIRTFFICHDKCRSTIYACVLILISGKLPFKINNNWKFWVLNSLDIQVNH